MSIPVLGTLDVLPKYDGQETTLPMLVVKREGPSLLGRNWLTKFRLNWHEIFWLHNTSLNEVLDKYKAVFEPGLGTVTGFKAKITVDPDATPKYCKACSVCPLFLPEEG